MTRKYNIKYEEQSKPKFISIHGNWNKAKAIQDEIMKDGVSDRELECLMRKYLRCVRRIRRAVEVGL